MCFFFVFTKVLRLCLCKSAWEKERSSWLVVIPTIGICSRKNVSATAAKFIKTIHSSYKYPNYTSKVKNWFMVLFLVPVKAHPQVLIKADFEDRSSVSSAKENLSLLCSSIPGKATSLIVTLFKIQTSKDFFA